MSKYNWTLSLIIHMVLQALPIFLLILLVAWWVALCISKPLHMLAKFSEDAILHNEQVHANNLKPRSMIYEVRQLYHHINKHLDILNTEIQKDELTGLANRKTFNLVIQEWMKNKIPFSLVLIDIDHFKNVNDTRGHLIGDEVLRFLASTMRTLSREGDLCFRYGGEEFGILVKYGDAGEAFNVAERLRKEIEKTLSPTGDAITISLGVTAYQTNERSPNELIEKADYALYQSKREGRNKTTIYSHEAANLGFSLIKDQGYGAANK